MLRRPDGTTAFDRTRHVRPPQPQDQSPTAEDLPRAEPRLPPLLPPPLLSPPSAEPPKAVVIMSPTAPVAAAAISNGAAAISPARLPAADTAPPVSCVAEPAACRVPPDDWPC